MRLHLRLCRSSEYRGPTYQLVIYFAIVRVMRIRSIVYIVLATFAVLSNCYAQESAPVVEEHGVVAVGKQFVRDEANLWTSPLRMNHEDLKWMVPLGIGAAALLKTDRSISSELAEDKRIEAPSHSIAEVGSYPLYLTPAAMMLLGHVTGNERTQETGSVVLRAVLHSAIIVQTLKVSTNRERPDKNRGDGGFWDGGKSFPSGHAMSSWAFASALSDQYPDKKWIGIGAYGMATAVSLSRISGQNHFPSDVLLGSSLGWLIGHYVSRRHK